jgi:hypothetical protein
MTSGSKRVSRTSAWVRPHHTSHTCAQTNELAGNVLSAKAPDEKIPFIAEGDLQVYQKYRDAAFEVQVGLHELTGTMK